MDKHQLESESRTTGDALPEVDARFELSERLGVRSFLGVDRETGADVVVKTIPISQVPGGALMQLEYESAYRQQVSSPWLVSPIYVGRTNDQLILASPFVTGTTLDSYLKRRKLTIVEGIRVGLALFSALRDLHEHGLLHRAVRPCHLVVNDELPLLTARLLDFGLPPTSLGSQERDAAGTLEAAHYISPEQAGSIDKDVTEPADLYSAGVTLFHCLAGRPPFTGSEIGAILFEHMTTRPPKLRSLQIAVPRALDEVLQYLLRKDPQDRYQTAAAVRMDLQAILDGLERGEPDPPVVVGTKDERQTLSEPSFVGRARELGQLDRQIECAQGGQPGLVLLEGESGGGKTRLLTEITQRAAGRGFSLMWGEGTNAVARRPFSLLNGLVDGFLRGAVRYPLPRASSRAIGRAGSGRLRGLAATGRRAGTAGWTAQRPRSSRRSPNAECVD